MAKRSVRRERRTSPPAPPRLPQAPEASGRTRIRSFASGLLAGVALSVPFVVVGNLGSDEAPAARVAPAEDASLVAARARDRAQVEALTARTLGLARDLRPALSGLAAALPAEGRPTPAPPAAVRRWRASAVAAHATFAESVSGETGTNVARGALAAGLGGLVQAVELYGLAREDPRLLPRARAWRGIAMDTLAVGTTQLDALNHEHGLGHHHVYFTAQP